MVLLLGIALYIALPVYQQQVLAANRSVGVAQLRMFQAQQERFHSQQGQYASTFAQLGYPGNVHAINGRGEAVDGLDAHRVYRFSLSTALAGYTISAIPQLAQAEDRQCHTLSINALGVRGITGTATGERCW